MLPLTDPSKVSLEEDRMAATFIRAGERVELDVSVEIDGPRKALVTGPGAVLFLMVLKRWAADGNYATTAFTIESENGLLEDCSYYSSGPSGGFYVKFVDAT